MSKEIHIFDLDNTLIANVPFSSFISDVSENNIINIENSEFKDYFLSVKGVFWNEFSKNIVFKKSGDFIVILNADTLKPFDSLYYDKLLTIKDQARNYDLHKGILTLEPYPDYHKNPLTIGADVNDEVLREYEKAKNKMILTGRQELLREALLRRLKQRNLPEPNFGLYMFPGGSESIKAWKSKVILQAIHNNDFTEVHFYEDRLDWLDFAKNAVNEHFPDVTFVAHLITNVKENYKLDF